jgi:hypothetical protein
MVKTDTMTWRTEQVDLFAPSTAKGAPCEVKEAPVRSSLFACNGLDSEVIIAHYWTQLGPAKQPNCAALRRCALALVRALIHGVLRCFREISMGLC